MRKVCTRPEVGLEGGWWAHAWKERQTEENNGEDKGDRKGALRPCGSPSKGKSARGTHMIRAGMREAPLGRGGGQGLGHRDEILWRNITGARNQADG